MFIQISYILDHSSIIESTDGAKTCRLGGDPITVKNISTKQEFTFTIVGSAEADPINGKISNTCPVAQAVIGHCEGNTVTVPVKIPYELLIKKIGA